MDQLVKNMPDYSVYFSRIYVDESSRIYVFVSDAQNELSQEIDIFSAEGEYLYHSELSLPGNLIAKSRLVLKDGYLYVFADDDEGERKLYKFKIQLPVSQS